MAERITVNSKKPVSIKENLISHKRKTDFRSNSSPVNRILYLQRTIGNQAVQRMVRSGALQAKLRIGQPRDVYEQEADRVADAVMRMPKPQVQRQVEPEEEEEETLQSKPLANPITPLVQVQRQEEPEEEEEMLQAKSLAEEITPLVQRQVEPEEEDEELQAKGLPSQTSKVIPNLESHINVIRGGGQPLSESTRAFFEPRFGYDFSQVRIHSNSEAAEMAGTLNAKAFTTGRDVVFGAGQYSPETSIGMRLLAHELTHVQQQQSSFNGFIINRYPRGVLEERAIAKGKKRPIMIVLQLPEFQIQIAVLMQLIAGGFLLLMSIMQLVPVRQPRMSLLQIVYVIYCRTGWQQPRDVSMSWHFHISHLIIRKLMPSTRHLSRHS